MANYLATTSSFSTPLCYISNNDVFISLKQTNFLSPNNTGPVFSTSIVSIPSNISKQVKLKSFSVIKTVYALLYDTTTNASAYVSDDVCPHQLYESFLFSITAQDFTLTTSPSLTPFNDLVSNTPKKFLLDNVLPKQYYNDDIGIVFDSSSRYNFITIAYSCFSNIFYQEYVNTYKAKYSNLKEAPVTVSHYYNYLIKCDLL